MRAIGVAGETISPIVDKLLSEGTTDGQNKPELDDSLSEGLAGTETRTPAFCSASSKHTFAC